MARPECNSKVAVFLIQMWTIPPIYRDVLAAALSSNFSQTLVIKTYGDTKQALIFSRIEPKPARLHAYHPYSPHLAF